MLDMTRFSDVFAQASAEYAPHKLCAYIYDLANDFNRFYHENQCNVEDQKLKEARVKIVILAKQVIKDGLDLLGIQCPEQM